MTKPEQSPAQMIGKAQAQLRAAESGLNDFISGAPHRKEIGFRSLVVYGRAVTNVLQNLRHKVAGFESWYEPYKEEMAADPLMRYFYVLRTKILKQGESEFRLNTEIKELKLPDDILASRAEGAERYAVGGLGVVWLLEREDGTIEKHFADLPRSMIDSEAISTSIDLPTTHLGKPIEDCSIQNLSKLYIDYLRRIIRSAEKTFA